MVKRYDLIHRGKLEQQLKDAPLHSTFRCNNLDHVRKMARKLGRTDLQIAPIEREERRSLVCSSLG